MTAMVQKCLDPFFITGTKRSSDGSTKEETKPIGFYLPVHNNPTKTNAFSVVEDEIVPKPKKGKKKFIDDDEAEEINREEMEAMKKNAVKKVESRSSKKIREEQEEFRSHLASIEMEKKRKRLQRLEDRSSSTVQLPKQGQPSDVPTSQVCIVSGGMTALVTMTKSQFSVIKIPTNLNSILRLVSTPSRAVKGSTRMLFDDDAQSNFNTSV